MIVVRCWFGWGRLAGSCGAGGWFVSGHLVVSSRILVMGNKASKIGGLEGLVEFQLRVVIIELKLDTVLVLVT